MIILTTAMFKQAGPYNLALDNTKINDLQAVIDEWESYYLYKMLSSNTPNTASLAALFIADCAANAGVPIIPRFVKIFNSFNEMSGSNMYSSKGMKAILMSFIAYHYITETASWSGTGGITAGDSSASKTPTMGQTYRWAESRFNDSIEYVKAVLWWIQSGNANGGGLSMYPEFVRVRDCEEVFSPKSQSIL